MITRIPKGLIVRCCNCATDWMYEKSDVRRKEEINIYSEKVTHDYIVCPRCGNHLEVFPEADENEKR